MPSLWGSPSLVVVIAALGSSARPGYSRLPGLVSCHFSFLVSVLPGI